AKPSGPARRSPAPPIGRRATRRPTARPVQSEVVTRLFLWSAVVYRRFSSRTRQTLPIGSNVPHVLHRAATLNRRPRKHTTWHRARVAKRQPGGAVPHRRKVVLYQHLRPAARANVVFFPHAGFFMAASRFSQVEKLQ